MEPLKLRTVQFRQKMCAWASQVRVKVALVSLVVCMGLIAAGVVLVTLESHRAQDDMLAQADKMAVDTSATITQTIQFAMTPLSLGVSRVGRRPSPEALLVGTPDSLYRDWLDLAPGGAALSFRMFYAGYLILSYTNPAAEAKYPRLQQLGTGQAFQANILKPQPPFPVSGRTNALYSMRTGRMVLQDISPALAPTLLLTLSMPVFVPATSAAETWGWPANMTTRECLTGELPCYNATTGKKWWGQIAVLLGRNEFSNLSAMQKLSTSGYGYRVSIAEDAPGLMTPAALAPTVVHTNLDTVSCASPSVMATDTLAPGLEVTVEICIVEGYTVQWFIPTLVLVAVVSVGLVVLIAFTVVTWMRHSELVRALLPDSAIQHLTRTLHPRKLSEEVSAGSPAEKLVSMLGLILSGKPPPVQDAIQVMAALKERADLYVPLDLEEHVRQAAGMDTEVVDALMAALVDGRRTIDGSAPRHLSGGHALHLSSAAVGLERLEEEGYGDLKDAMMSITGLRRARGPPAAEEATLITTEFFLLDTVGVSRAPVVQRTHHSLTFSEVEQGEIICNSLLDTTGFLKRESSRPQPSIILELEVVLMGASSLSGDFDAWRLDEASQGHPLSALGYWCFHQAGLLQELRLPGKQLAGFLRALESGYRDNPYHNKTHAAHVLQGMHAFLHTGGLRGKYADSFTTAACYLAAAMHDYDHRGVTNDYLITTKNELAQRYNDRSPHENHHVSAGFGLLNMDENNFLSHLPPAEWVRMRRIVIELILGTDMKQHFAINGGFSSVHRLATAERVQRIIEGRAPGSMSGGRRTTTGYDPKSTSTELAQTSNAQLSAPISPVVMQSTPANVVVGPISGLRFERQTMDGQAIGPAPTRFVPQTETLSPARATTQTSGVPSVLDTNCVTNSTNLCTSGPAPVDEAERLLSLQMMLKCADLGHICTSRNVHLKWVKCLEAEMFQQGDREREQGLPISPLCDRNSVGVTKSQVGFFEVVVLPLLSNFTGRFPSTKPVLDSAVANYHYWQAQAVAGQSSNAGN